MKRFIFAIIIFVLSACTEYTIGYEKDELLSLSTDKIEMECDGGQTSVEVESICPWDLSIGSNCNWVHSSVNHGNGGKNSITITIDKNNAITPRSATITISNEQCNISYQIAIDQKAGVPNVDIITKELTFTGESGVKGLKIISNIDYTITSSQEWCTIDATKGGSGEKELQVRVTKNSTIEPRIATVKIENSEYKIVKEVVITQGSSTPAINVSETEIFLNEGHESKEIEITSNIPWVASCEANWVTLSRTTGTSGTTLLQISITSNPQTNIRSTTIKIVNEEYQLLHTISISQKFWQSYVETYLNIQMIFVEGGTFQMGSNSSDANSDEQPVHSVTLDSYYIADSEITQSQWFKIMGTTISQQKDLTVGGGDYTYGIGDNYPMYYVNLEEAGEFCRKLSKLTSKNYTIPTEAQWEYAARGGNKSNGYKYSGSYVIGNVAWYNGNGNGHSNLVRQKSPNELGLYDMSGNVHEWCLDRYASDYYSYSPQINPTGPTSNDYFCVIRGGSWYNNASSSRVSCRSDAMWMARSPYIGFRIICAP